MRADPSGPVPTSSSTRPSLMARMLTLLDVSDGQTVLEIGTGTGYNAALLSWRLGDANVTSIDLDPALVETARERLTGLGWQPHLYAGDGRAGVPEHAPYERIIATAAVPAIPPAWIRQLSMHSGQLVADLRGNLSSSLVVARKTSPDTVRGRFLAEPGHFMWLRPRVDHPGRHGADNGAVFDFTDPSADTTEVPLDGFSDPDFRFWLQFAVPGLGPIGNVIRDGQAGIFLLGDTDASWVEISPAVNGRAAVACGGPRSLWPDISDAWFEWIDFGRPQRRCFGLTAHSDGTQELWLDHDKQVILGRSSTTGNQDACVG